MQIWIVAQTKADKDGNVTNWELGGVYSTEERALADCTERTDCYWPANLDEPFGRETTYHGVYPARDR